MMTDCKEYTGWTEQDSQELSEAIATAMRDDLQRWICSLSTDSPLPTPDYIKSEDVVWMRECVVDYVKTVIETALQIDHIQKIILSYEANERIKENAPGE